MKEILFFITMLFGVCFLNQGCKKNSPQIPVQQYLPPPVSADSMQRCHVRSAGDSAAIRGALLNRWNWEFITCYWNPEDANGEDFKNLSILFKSNDSLEITNNGSLVQTSHWQLERLNDGYYKLITNPLVLQLTGKVLLCNGRMLLYDSYVDGCDNYFIKAR